MARRSEDDDGHRYPRPRPPLPPRADDDDTDEMTHANLIEELRATDGPVDVTGGRDDRPNFHLRHKPYLHFHETPEGEIYADVKVGGGPSADFEPVWASTPAEREALLRRVRKHVRRVHRG